MGPRTRIKVLKDTLLVEPASALLVVVTGEFLVEGVAVNSNRLGGFRLIAFAFFQRLQDEFLFKLTDSFFKK